MTVRLRFNRDGGMIAEPRVTYITPGIPPHVRQVYWDAVTAALNRCAPLQFTDGLGGALADVCHRFVDNQPFFLIDGATAARASLPRQAIVCHGCP